MVAEWYSISFSKIRSVNNVKDSIQNMHNFGWKKYIYSYEIDRVIIFWALIFFNHCFGTDCLVSSYRWRFVSLAKGLTSARPFTSNILSYDQMIRSQAQIKLLSGLEYSPRSEKHVWIWKKRLKLRLGIRVRLRVGDWINLKSIKDVDAAKTVIKGFVGVVDVLS